MYNAVNDENGLNVWFLFTVLLMCILLINAVTEEMRFQGKLEKILAKPKTINDKSIEDFLGSFNLSD